MTWDTHLDLSSRPGERSGEICGPLLEALLTGTQSKTREHPAESTRTRV
jgi:hypothetical protein